MKIDLCNYNFICLGGCMLVVTGIFENERFIPDRPVSIPQKKKVVVTIEEKCDTGIKPANKGNATVSVTSR
jgi:hypothetical protein